VLSAANTYTEVSVPIPKTGFNIPRGKALVMELLKFYADTPAWDANPAAGGNVALAVIQLATGIQPTYLPSSGQVLAFYSKEYRGAFTAAGSYSSVASEPMVYDCTDGAGHGVLIATDRFIVGATTGNYAAAATFQWKALYRFKLVSVEEYIGIVQAQAT